MQESSSSRRNFIKSMATTGLALGLTGSAFSLYGQNVSREKKRVGIIGLDTSHSVAFTKVLNDPQAAPEYGGYKVVAAYPKGSNDIESSTKRIPGYTEEVQKYGVKIVDSVKKLLNEVDVVLLETNDGRLHLEQALQVFKAGKPTFIDKPIAASLADTMAIFEVAKKYKVPVFSSSSLRYMPSAQEVVQGKVGKVLGAEAFSPMHLESTHPDLVWYGIHGVETLYTVMGTGCKSVVRVHTPDTDVVVGTWADGRIGTFRGLRSGKLDYGGMVYGEKGNLALGPYGGYNALLAQIIKFFQTGQPPVSAEETTEMFAFMEAADESKRQGGVPVSLESMLQKAKQASRN
ncbi:Gfo/Idh/MocA family protein [Adhaeribacter rhizoryzae]|uniref:Gfo/Idh/MocA family oxidoreductase n=1 Tax=Adhaeribacter rhizoryzae TaxID=2607907 RepID=A0A5M6DBR8_9BACT|nr:Gfo/Idh/MocA family oxidoreductase [Adhaeribacter rhizoryzae]KAA5544977.1 Gfo/Idh/MocA family oxidoreductase [Adhaeribacter rhizoryzae]